VCGRVPAVVCIDVSGEGSCHSLLRTHPQSVGIRLGTDISVSGQVRENVCEYAISADVGAVPSVDPTPILRLDWLIDRLPETASGRVAW